jgi:type VI protein secretion system component VasF
MRKVSVGILALVGVAVLLISLASTNLAYRGDYEIGGVGLADVAQNRAHVLSALRGIRGTSAAYAGAFAVLWLGIVFGPYKRGETWAWWTLAAAVAFLAVIVLLRIPLVGERLGVGSAMVVTGLSVLGLLLDAGRLRQPTA